MNEQTNNNKNIIVEKKREKMKIHSKLEGKNWARQIYSSKHDIINFLMLFKVVMLYNKKNRNKNMNSRNETVKLTDRKKRRIFE